jgi:hypothetical protein
MLTNLFIWISRKVGTFAFIETTGIKSLDLFLMNFGFQDLFLNLAGILLFRWIIKMRNSTLRILVITFYLLSYLYLFPHFAATFEAQRVLYFVELRNDIIDGFNLLYVWFRFPIYWIIGISIPLGRVLGKRLKVVKTKLWEANR